LPGNRSSTELNPQPPDSFLDSVFGSLFSLMVSLILLLFWTVTNEVLMQKIRKGLVDCHFFFNLLAVLEFELGSLLLQSRYSSTWPTPLVHFAVIILEVGSPELFAQAGLEPWSCWSCLPSRIIGMRYRHPTKLDNILKSCSHYSFLQHAERERMKDSSTANSFML
jgi:hypothetical protein